MYLVPLTLLILGAMGAFFRTAEISSGWRDLFALLGGAIGLVVGLRWARHVGENGASRRGFEPVILRRESQ